MPFAIFLKLKCVFASLNFKNYGTDQLFNTIFLMGWIDMD